MQSLLRYAAMLLFAASLAVSFMAYLQPDFMLGLANRIMLCF